MRSPLTRRQLAGLVVGFFREFVGLIGVLKRAQSMPLCCFVVPFFVVLGGSAMSAGRKFVLLGGFPVCFVHVISLAMRCSLSSHRDVGAGFTSGRNVLSAGMF
jgi:hypothetical protein